MMSSLFTNSQISNAELSQFTENQGLAVNFIKTISYDNEGFIWLGGENHNVRNIINNSKRISIQRFNGRTFQSFELPNYEEPIVSIENIQKRKDGKLYIRAIVNSGQSLLLFDPISGDFKRIFFDKNKTILDAISNVFTYNNQEYILTQEGKTIFLNILSENLQLKPVFSFVPKTDKKYLLETSTLFIPYKEFIIISDDNFTPLVFDWDGNFIHNISGNNIQKTFVKNGLRYIIKSNDSQLYALNEETKNITPIKSSIFNGELLDVISDDFGNIAIIVLENNFAIVYKFIDTHHLEEITKFPFQKKDFIKGHSKNIDKSIWLGTKNKELLLFKKVNYTNNYLQKNSIRSLLQLNTNKFLVAIENKGWYIINTKKKTTKPFSIIHNKKQLKPYSTRNFIREGNYVWANDHDNIIKVNLKNGIAEKWNHYPVICMEKPNDSLIFYGTKEYHLMQFNVYTKKHKKLIKTDTLFIYDLAVKKNSKLIICATNKGVLKYNFKTKKHYLLGKKEGIEDDFILMADTHKKHNYLLGTKSGKIISYNPKNNQFKTLYADNLKMGIATISYDDNLWWISTFNGLVSYNTNTKKTTRFSDVDGLSHNEGNRYSAISTHDKLLIGSLKGLSVIDKKSIQKNKTYSNLVLLSISKFDKKQNKFRTFKNRKELAKNNEIRLAAEYKNLEITFALTNRTTNADHKYRYRINDKNWINLADTQKINFINLASGNYNLEIEAIDFSGNKVASPLFLTIVSEDFFYNTYWFFAIIFMSITLFFIWMLKQSKQKQKLQQLFSQDLIESREQERTRIAKELHDSVNQQLTLIKKKTQKLKLESVSEMINSTLEEVRSISRGLYPNILKQLGLTESIEQLFLDIDEETNLFVTLDIENIDAFFDEKQALNIYRIIQELTSNVLKHAKSKTLSLEVRKSSKLIEILLSDNGTGFEITEAKTKKSLGLKTLEERVQILKGEIFFNSKPNMGTKVSIKINL